MKELSIEEKAKAYDMALDKIERLLGIGDNCSRKELEHIFPELKESEDERIRKALISVFSNREKYLIDQSFGDITVSEALAWLEKQGEHANFLNKIQIGDKVTRNEDGILVNLSQLNRVAKKQGEHETLCDKCRNEQPSHSCQDITALGRCAVEHEQKPADKVEPKFKVGQTIKKEGFNLGFTIVKIEDGFYYNDMGDYFPFTGQDDWELVEQKPAEWSEEDEAIYYGVIETEQYMLDVVNGIKKFAVGNISIKEECTRELNWLKSLKDRVGNFDDGYKVGFSAAKHNQWKPSDEQMEALLKLEEMHVLEHEKTQENAHLYMMVKSIREQLLKLREE